MTFRRSTYESEPRKFYAGDRVVWICSVGDADPWFGIVTRVLSETADVSFTGNVEGRFPERDHRQPYLDELVLEHDYERGVRPWHR